MTQCPKTPTANRSTSFPASKSFATVDANETCSNETVCVRVRVPASCTSNTQRICGDRFTPVRCVGIRSVSPPRLPSMWANPDTSNRGSADSQPPPADLTSRVRHVYASVLAPILVVTGVVLCSRAQVRAKPPVQVGRATAGMFVSVSVSVPLRTHSLVLCRVCCSRGVSHPRWLGNVDGQFTSCGSIPHHSQWIHRRPQWRSASISSTEGPTTTITPLDCGTCVTSSVQCSNRSSAADPGRLDPGACRLCCVAQVSGAPSGEPSPYSRGSPVLGCKGSHTCDCGRQPHPAQPQSQPRSQPRPQQPRHQPQRCDVRPNHIRRRQFPCSAADV